jgi:hypothetical protein
MRQRNIKRTEVLSLANEKIKGAMQTVCKIINKDAAFTQLLPGQP